MRNKTITTQCPTCHGIYTPHTEDKKKEMKANGITIEHTIYRFYCPVCHVSLPSMDEGVESTPNSRQRYSREMYDFIHKRANVGYKNTQIRNELYDKYGIVISRQSMHYIMHSEYTGAPNPNDIIAHQTQEETV